MNDGLKISFTGEEKERERERDSLECSGFEKV
jgi:hypothetical protein